MNLIRSRSISLIFPARANLATAVDLAPKTRERYVELAENQIIPHLGDIKLAKLKPEHLADLACRAA
jgi:Phage integrase, N-terminal SAM-like domain